jgi:CheY-like chemotaxis protein
MAAGVPKRKRVLFVDDEPAFLETIAAVIESTQAELWEPYFAESAGKALSILQEQPMNLVVIDIEMPVIDGLQFLSLVHRKHPNLSKVVLTGYATEQHRAACLSGGAELFLEKPRTPQDLQSILATLHELARLQPEEGFRGVLRRVGLTDIIQMECLSRHSVVLYVSTQAGHGEIFIKDGSIIHAQAGELTGEPAFNHVLGLKGGEFDLRPYVEPPAQTIEGQWEFLLMEAARQVDEQAEASANDAATATTASISSSAAEPANGVNLADLPDLFKAPAAAPPEATAKSEPASLPVATDTDEQPTRVDEMLICSPQGDVIYEWQCPDASGRINFLEFLSQKSRQFSPALGFGAFDRLEVLTPQAKVVAQLQADCGVFVRTSKLEPTTADEELPPLRMTR